MFPQIEWILLAPVLAIFLSGIFVVLVETFVSPKYRYYCNAVACNIALIVAFIFAVYNLFALQSQLQRVFVEGELSYDLWSAIAQVLLIFLAFISFQALTYRNLKKQSAVFISNPALNTQNNEKFENTNQYFENERTEYFALIMFSFGGMLVFSMAYSFLTLFIALEIMSLPLYVMVALNKNMREESKEGAVKYFLMGSFASAIMLMGIALLYGVTGKYSFGEIHDILPEMSDFAWGYILGVLFILIGMLFKIGAVPFHAWTPDAYQVAPTNVTGFMATTVKFAGFIVLTRFVFSINPNLNSYMSWFYLAVIILTILVGTFAGLVQTNIKRMLAYSSIAHTGFLLMSVLVVDNFSNGSLIYYLFSYGIATIGAFAVISMVGTVDGDGKHVEDNSLIAYKGLGKNNPFLAVSLLVFLLSFAGIPLTSGFIGKFMIFTSAMSKSLGWLVFIGVFASIVTAFYYLRVIVLMFTNGEEEILPSESSLEKTGIQNKLFTVKSINKNTFVICVCLVLTILLGVFPSIFFNLIPIYS